MWFKNVIFYRLTDSFSYTQEQLQQKLQEQAYTPCKSQELSRYGWVSPCRLLDDMLAHEVHGMTMIAARKEEKILPSSVIKDAVSEKVAVIEQEQARKVYKKEKDQLKDEVILDLLPRAFSRFQQTTALISPSQGWIAVDASSHKRAEELLSHLRGTLGSLPLTLPDVNQSPSAVMSNWLEHNETIPDGFAIMDECELRDNVMEGGVIRIKGQQLEDEEFVAHLEAGKRVTKLALGWDEQIKIVLNDDLSIKRLKLTEQLQEKMADEAAEDEVAQFDADMVQMGLELAKLYPALIAAFGGEAQRP
ncbi:recombination-associated protein RdgC [Neptuniibacter sp.]|uniref:recombination-associated protein RdgC n=1 Tax=Neptuniibacter sp. TaxID=1962643 RepID=UPI00262D3E40|nr:recombination-associated protein RdgC [Neptuniibacter sp.]MCP4595055.1 recombination-associated protein RdgC [Neptuniibacter sp.]